jgi:hypothetical protein
MADHIVDDQEYRTRKNALTPFGEASTVDIGTYNALLDDAQEKSITSGDTAENLRAFALQAKLMEKKVELLIDDICKEVEAYLLDIDTADSYIYYS